MEETSISNELIDVYRYINVEDTWWSDYHVDAFKERMKGIGWDVANVYWSGFCSQGDGASFSGGLDDPELFLNTCFPNLEQYRLIRHVIELGGGLRIEVSRYNTHYAHSNTVSFNIDCDNFTDLLPIETPLHKDTAYALDTELGLQLIDFEEAVVPMLKSYMDKLYEDLGNDYEHLTSDAQVKETIISNELGE